MPIAPIANRMLDAYPRDGGPPSDLLIACIEACHDCAQACTQCADDCLAEEGRDLARCIRLNLDCSDVCLTTGRVISRQTGSDPGLIGPVLEACASACEVCAGECELHAGEMAHCRVCAEQCRECAEACRSLLGAVAA